MDKTKEELEGLIKPSKKKKAVLYSRFYSDGYRFFRGNKEGLENCTHVIDFTCFNGMYYLSIQTSSQYLAKETGSFSQIPKKTYLYYLNRYLKLSTDL